MQRPLLIFAATILVAIVGLTAVGDDAVDPMRRVIGQPPQNPFDPMRALPQLETYIEFDPMGYYARRAAVEPGDPMAALRGIESEGAPIGDEKLGGLPPGEGQAITLGLCSMCHSIQMVTQQRLPQHRWDELWVWMIKEQGMPDVGPETRDVVVGYLKKNFSAPSTTP